MKNCFFITYCLLTLISVNGQQELSLKVLDLRIDNKYAAENTFIKKPANFADLPVYDHIKNKLPIVIWPKRQDVLDCYNYAWRTAFTNLYKPGKENGFISPFIDAAFNKNIFMWDTGFMTLFGRYGENAFNFQGSLDNFYAKQHKDGYICREIRRSDGTDNFERYDISSTGPNILPWAEWEYYLNFKDEQRLQAVFPVLLAYYQWYRTYRSWPDGSYFSSGWGCGVDNQPRLPEGINATWGQAHMSWIDITLQQIFSGNILIKMAAILKRDKDIEDIVTEVRHLTNYVNDKMWDDAIGFYVDRFKDGSLSNTKSVVAYWALLANICSAERAGRFIQHLSDTTGFNRPFRIPALSYDNPEYRADGGYWNGGVWAPVTYMVLRGLTNYKQDSLAHAIALNNLDNVVKIYKETGTLWEHYAPELKQGMGVKNFVGWTGLVPISILFEYVLGIRADVPAKKIVWDLRLTDQHGIENYPLGNQGLISLIAQERKNPSAQPVVKIKSNTALTLDLVWNGGSRSINVVPGEIYKTYK